MTRPADGRRRDSTRRAGVLEQITVGVLRTYGLGERMDREGHQHDGIRIGWAAATASSANCKGTKQAL